MISIQYPEPEFRIKKQKDKEFIFDTMRRKWLLLTPEEWVRQNFIQYLVRVLDYPASLIAIEKEIMLYELKKRFDILIYDKNHQPWMIVECKAPAVKLDDQVLHQVLRYNISVPVGFIIITNGGFTYGWEKKNNTLMEMNQLPSWK